MSSESKTQNVIAIKNDLHLESGTQFAPELLVYICLCKAVTDHDIEAAVLAGADSLDQVQHELAVSSGCGKCATAAQVVVEQALAKRCDTGESESGLGLTALPALELSALVYAA